MQPYKVRNCKAIPRMKTLRLRPLLTGGFLTATRHPSCAAAAEDIVTSNPFVPLPAAWGGRGPRGARRLGAPPGMASPPPKRYGPVGAHIMRPPSHGTTSVGAAPCGRPPRHGISGGFQTRPYISPHPNLIFSACSRYSSARASSTSSGQSPLCSASACGESSTPLPCPSSPRKAFRLCGAP